ncbi:MAG: hypothetical protein OZ948_07680 [Deltaproteobacteria bacterium]|nr:hypothetical protein [Deltaproteobacteria bacterium]
MVRPQITLRLSREELGRLDAAAARLHLERAALIRAAALGAAELVLEAARPLVLAVEPSALLRRAAEQLAAGTPAAPEHGRAAGRRKR